MTLDLSAYRSAVSEHALASIDSIVWLIRSAHEDSVAAEMLEPARALLSGGKRTRASLLWAGYRCATDSDGAPAVRAGAALELYHASALVHDDVVDDSETRRGLPAAHTAFSARHSSRRWLGSAAEFGHAGAIVLGDLLLSQASVEFHDATRIVEPEAGSLALEQFLKMTVEVAFGQYLDIRAEHQPLVDTSEAIESALGVLRHKSASYSVEFPLAIGALLGGGSLELAAQLRQVGQPLGEAFQMRDDELGVFGDPELTGKPACGDIAEGKRTVLLALTRELSAPADRQWLDARLGQKVSDDDVVGIRRIVEESGARARHEEMIAAREDEARRNLSALDSRAEGVDLLDTLVHELEGRHA
ncbi:polyprenyl synthetase family protein [Actinomycetaceae bacterium L2_0104]